MSTTPTQKQIKPFNDLLKALERVGFGLYAGGEGMNRWVECRIPEAGQLPIPDEHDKFHGQHALHFEFDCTNGNITNYAITRDVWEKTDQENVVDVRVRTDGI